MNKPLALIIDDDPDLVRIIEIMVQDFGFDTRVANNSDDALKLAHSEQPAVILLDLNLPTAGGHAVLRALHAESATASTPVIMLSASDPYEHSEKSRAEGAFAYLQKPFSGDELQRLIVQAVNKKI